MNGRNYFHPWLQRPFRIKEQGVYQSGEANWLIQGAEAKANSPQHCEGLGVKAPLVTLIIPEPGRSKPEQGEASRLSGGSPKRCYEQVLLRLWFRSDKLIVPGDIWFRSK